MFIAVDFMSCLRENFILVNRMMLLVSDPDDCMESYVLAAADIDEMSIMREKPEDLVLALAEAKADTIVSWLGIQGHKEENVHPGYDTNSRHSMLYSCLFFHCYFITK
ncbi:putative inosine triphosphate pyrophosphatase [Helianthus debilis subsp. tardiflorus]